MKVFVTIRMSIGDDIIDYCIGEMLAKGIKPSRITVGAIRKRAHRCYETYGLQAEGGTPDNAGFDLDDDYDQDGDTWETIVAVRWRLGI